MLLCLILWGAPIGSLYAQASPDAGPSLVNATSKGAQTNSMGGMLWVYLTALCIGLAGFGVYLLRRARPNFVERSEAAVTQLPLVASPPPLPQHSPARTRPFRDSGRFQRAEVSQRKEPAKPLFNTSGEGQQKICPSCRRTYASWMVICPVDAAPLQHNPAASRKRKGATAIERMRCTSCAYRFNVGATYCGLDGTKLSQDTIEAAEVARVQHYCMCCGTSHESPEHPTCCSTPELLSLDPSDLGPSMMALTICPKCHTMGQPGQIHCAHDGTLLAPFTPMERNALPHLGHGTKRSICNTCGETFGGGYTHCTFDGSTLRPLH